MNEKLERQDGICIGGMLLAILYIILNPIPGPIDDTMVVVIGRCKALQGL